jgi:Mg-chelatase subunit ChlD
VIDASSSMAAASPDGSTPLGRSLNAASELLSALTTSDRAALVTFDGTATVLAGLGPPDAARSALEAVTTGAGSRLDLGVIEGARLLAGARAGEEARLVLISDGAGSDSDLDAAVSALTDAKALAYALGYGNPAHSDSLEYVVGTAARVWIEPAPDAASELPDRMRVDAGCPWAP